MLGGTDAVDLVYGMFVERFSYAEIGYFDRG